MANDEILFKVAADLSQLKPQFQDLSEFWKKHNEDIAKGEKAMNDYAKNTEASYRKVNGVIKEKISNVANEGKTLQALDKTLTSIVKSNKDAFSDTELKKFDETLKRVSGDISNIENLQLNLEDIDELTKKLGEAEDDFDTLNVLVDFFDRKLKEASVSAVGSIDDIQKKIRETELNIKSTQDFIKDIDKEIDSAAPGKLQAGLIEEREAAKKALNEEIVALKDYKFQLEQVRKENVSLTTELRKVKDEMIKLELEGKRDSARWQELSEKSREYGEAIRTTNEELRRTTSSTQGLDNLIGAVNGIVGVFAAAEGARALFGEGVEDLQKALVKLNGAIALLNGLQAIQTELTKKETLAGRAYSAVQKQVAIATDSTAKSTLRLKAALNLLGIGLIVSALGFLVTHWRDIAKYVGIISDESERLNEVNKKANDIYGEQIAELKILTDRVKEGGLSFKEKATAVETYNEKLGDTFGTVKTYAELEKRLIESGPAYIKYLELKAKAEAAYQLAVEKTKEALLKRSDTEVTFLDIVNSVGIGGVVTPPSVTQAIRTSGQASQLEDDIEALLAIQRNTLSEMEKLAAEMGLVLADPVKKLSADEKKLISLFEDLIRKQKELKVELIENDQEREKTALQQQFDIEKEAYAKQIEQLKVTEEQKKKLREEFNKLYNEQTGLAYEELQKKLLAIDQKYANELEKVQLKALSAIDSVLLGNEENDRKAIIDKWDVIRKEIQDQIDKTDDDFSKETLKIQLGLIDSAQKKELQDFDTNVGLERVDREKEIADTVLSIYQQNSKDLIKNEELKQLQLLQLQRRYLLELLNVFKDGLESDGEKSGFQNLIDNLQSSVNPSEIVSIGEKLRQAFGDETASEILKTVEALKEVNQGISETESQIKSGFSKIVSDIGAWTASLESFSLKLAETLGLEGRQAEEFAQGLSTALHATLDSLNSIFDSEIKQQREKIDALQETIDGVEDELDRERQLYEDGFANNFEARQKDLETLKAQKAQEEEELRKAQKNKALLAKAEIITDSVSQLSNLITAASNIFKWASKIPFVGVPLAIGLITAMFTAFAAAKVKALQSIGSGQSFRRGLKEGKLDLSGPSHEEKGFGVYNSRTGERVAEFEDGEEVYVANRQQKKKYRHVLDALIADAQGRADIDSTLEGYYHKKSKVDGQTRGVIKHISQATIKHQKAKQSEGARDEEVIDQLSKFREDFNREFKGFKGERESHTESWETSKFYYVRKGNVIKRYPKSA